MFLPETLFFQTDLNAGMQLRQIDSRAFSWLRDGQKGFVFFVYEAPQYVGQMFFYRGACPGVSQPAEFLVLEVKEVSERSDDGVGLCEFPFELGNPASIKYYIITLVQIVLHTYSLTFRTCDLVTVS